jgi:hypothetical protein
MPKLLFTDEVYALIRQLVSENVPTEEIAVRIGTTANSLKVRCSQNKISLRTPNWKKRRQRNMKVLPKASPLVALPKPKVVPQKTRQTLTMQSSIALSRVAHSLLRQRADAIGVTEAALVTNLLEVIARENLYDAVLDTKSVAA